MTIAGEGASPAPKVSWVYQSTDPSGLGMANYRFEGMEGRVQVYRFTGYTPPPGEPGEAVWVSWQPHNASSLLVVYGVEMMAVARGVAPTAQASKSAHFPASVAPA